MLRILLLSLFLAAPAQAQMLTTGVGPGSARGPVGGVTFTATGPSTGLESVASTNFTVTRSTGTFSGAETITIADGAAGGTITPSVGSPGTSTVTVTPTVSTSSFTFTYTPVYAVATRTLTFTNAQAWANPGNLTYAATYRGIGDIITATQFYGLRAYNGAYAAATGNIAIFRRSSDNATCTGKAATNGDLDLTTTYCSGPTNLSNFCAGGGNCFVSTLYDQSGANACAGPAPCDVVQATAVQQPQLVFNCINTSLPCLQFILASSQFLQTSGVTTTFLSAPYTLGWAAKHTASATNDTIMGAGAVPETGHTPSNLAFVYSGTVAQATAADGVFNIAQFIVNGASSSIVVNATSTSSLNAGSSAWGDASHGVGIGWYAVGAGNFFGGNILEAYSSAGAMSAGNLSAVCHNMFSYWATAVSC